MTSILDAAHTLADRTIAFRRRLHQHPELGLDLPITKQAVLDEIADLGLKLRLSESTSAVVAELDGAHDGPTLILRGDMDALPLQEDTGLPFASQIPGTMHACGHDTHVAMLAGAARLLAGRRDEIAGRVLLFFQPGEEGHHGARHALDEGLLDDPDVAGAFALHIISTFASGTIHVRPGPTLASADDFRVVLTGRGGHASAPHKANDPIPAACEIVTSLQVVLSRRTDTFDPAVLTVGQITAGTTSNVIPASAELHGTIRALSEETRADVHERLRTVANGIAAAHELTAEVEITPGYPVTVNDPAFADSVEATAQDLLGEANVARIENPLMGAEDFSYVLARYPGAMAFLGACPPDVDPERVAPNHSNLVVFDEAALANGVAMYAAVALDRLRPGTTS
ncbi:M20 metallopeptidase family protein [Phytoactinopolyspora mesophila]|uniref:Amidohydrolase n=1 Tax=Phytoactinopolyspora mesophila TaxID=2650750 RepID=A0A7K3M1C5_9ACTN|nr:M20 family metallopeptidase [Phytoactinopolyspora mesophila]NDL56847.1 amidohydrolase [Phytoactinopolyspora mesophila]